MLIPRNSVIAEIGVWRGDFSTLITEAACPRLLYLVDPWSDSAEFVPWAGKSSEVQNARDIFEDAYRHTRQRFSNSPNVQIVRAPSIEGAKEIPDGSLDLAYIDGAHDYENVLADLRAWAPKVRLGGLLCGDDYKLRENGEQQVRRAVDEFIREIRPKRWTVYRGQFLIQTA